MGLLQKLPETSKHRQNTNIFKKPKLNSFVNDQGHINIIPNPKNIDHPMFPAGILGPNLVYASSWSESETTITLGAPCGWEEWPRICSGSKHSRVIAVLSFYGGVYSKKFFMLQVSANLRPLLL